MFSLRVYVGDFLVKFGYKSSCCLASHEAKNGSSVLSKKKRFSYISQYYNSVAFWAPARL